MLLSWVAVLVLASGTAIADRHAVVVFGAAVDASGVPSELLVQRLESAREAAVADPRALVVVSGGSVASPAIEGRVMESWLAARGVDKGRIRVEGRARHTGENADFVVPILRAEGVDRVTLVTSRFHMQRALFHLRSALAEQGVLGVEVTSVAAPDGLGPAARARMAVQERAKIVRDAGKRAARSWLQRARERRPGKRAVPARRSPRRAPIRGVAR